jgi:acyl-CoA synthetase
MPQDLRDRYLADGLWTDETLGARVERCLRGAPDVTVNIWSETREWHGTYGQLHQAALRLVGALQDLGIEPGSSIAFQLPNWREAIVAFYGLALGGYVLVPIVHSYGPKEVRFILRESGARVYVSPDRFAHLDYLDLIDSTPATDVVHLEVHLVVRTEESSLPAGAGVVRRVAWSVVDRAEPARPAEAVDPDDVCVIAYTSGTTSEPKGVMYSHRTLGAELRHMGPWITPDAPNLMGSPIAHATGMLGAVLGPMEFAQAIHVIDRWDPKRALGIVLDAQIGAGTGASVFLASIIDHEDFTPEHAKYVRRVGLGGAPVPVALAERAASHGISIIRAYGSTEHPSITGSDFSDDAAKRHATDGRPLAGVEMVLRDEQGSPVPPGTPGEIWSRGPDLCVGYTDPSLDVAAFDEEGWYRTGDMGVVDTEGFLTITDRLNDVIIRGGANISAAEIEGPLNGALDIVEVAVVSAPDERLGERACVVARLHPGAEALTVAAIQSHLAEIGVARSKWPEVVRVVADFPRTASGKIRKVELRAMLRDGRL